MANGIRGTAPTLHGVGRQAADFYLSTGRSPLPQLPLEIGVDRVLRAGGGFSGPIGPAWLGVRKA